ncbi:MAG: PAS domain S-box protein [Desulfobacter sp.]|nr:PAS domain S-box protein [Desulfobacter sp.]
MDSGHHRSHCSFWNRLLNLQVKRHTQKLKASEEKYRTLSQNALVGIYQVTRQGVLVLANQRMAQIFGYESEQALLNENENIATLFKDPDQLDNLVLEIDQTGTIQGKRMELVSRDRQQIWGNLYLRQAESNGSTRIYEGFLEDISLRYRHELLLKSKLMLNKYSANHTTAQTLQKFLDQAEILTQSSIGFFHLLSKDQRTIQLHAWSTRTRDEMCKAAPEKKHYPVHQAGVWADCIREKKPVIHNDYNALTHKRGCPRATHL